MRATAHHRHLPVAAAVVLLLAGCGNDEPAGAEGGSPSVDIVDNDYEPATIEIAVGDTVGWTNIGDVAHTVTFSEGGPNSGMMQTDATYSNTFDEAGEFDYVCIVHPGMTGTVVVAE